MKFPLNVIIWLIPLILILGYFSFYSGSTLYFLIGMVFFFGTLIVIYPFYSRGYEIKKEMAEAENIRSEAETLENLWEDALAGKAVAQRMIEERVYSIAVEEIMDRFGIGREEAVRLIESGDIELDQQVKEALKKMLSRRHSMEIPTSREEFENEIKTIINFIGG